MILQALYRLAHDERLMEDPDFEWRPVPWLVRVGVDGELLGIEGTHHVPGGEDEGTRRKPRPRPKTFEVPREGVRTSGDRAFFLFDKAEYVFAIDPDGERPVEKIAPRFALFRERVERCLAATGDAGVRAVARLLERIAAGDLVPELPEGCAGADLFAFVFAPDLDLLVTSRPDVRAYWRSLRRAADEVTADETFTCLVTGHACRPAGGMPLLKHVPSGTPSGVALFFPGGGASRSYGLEGHENAPVSRAAAEACSTALNRLLHPAFPDPSRPGSTLPRRHVRLSADTAVVYWSTRPRGDDLAASLAGLFEANPEEVGELYRSLWAGEACGLDDPSTFFALTLSGAQGRATLRDWLESSVAEVAGHLAEHFADLAMVRLTPPPKGREQPPALPLRAVLRSLAPRGDDKGVPADLAGRVVRAALAGGEYPFGLLVRAVERARAEVGLDAWSDRERRDARAALLKAVLNRRRRFHPTTDYPEVTVAMDPTNTQIGYLLGRLMAVIERMQQAALGGDVNATVIDRFFSAASATPGAVFPRLLKGLRHHARKALDDDRTAGLAGSLEAEADRILTHVQGFPAHLPLAQQGLFVIGYHHQRHWSFLPREERERRLAAAAAAGPSGSIREESHA